MTRMRRLLCVPVLLAIGACGEQAAPEETPPNGDTPPAASLSESFWSEDAPGGAVEVMDLRSLGDGSEVVVRGEVKEFVGGLAAFQLADHALTSCAEMAEPDHCQTPWDFCCEDPAALQRGTALVELREGGELLASSVRGYHGIDHLTDLVVEGELRIDEAGNLTVVARSIARE